MLDETEHTVTIDSAVQKVLAPITNKLIPVEILGSLKVTKVAGEDTNKKSLQEQSSDCMIPPRNW
ncbi:hypothetical protein ACFTAO_06895 [Paenibacillus rhizoplanae]